ncbi:MAG: hypothetical protein AB7O64_13925 [Methylibium sp.]
MSIPKPIEFLLSVPLYAPVAYEGEQVWEVLDVLYLNGTYDSFCVKCKRESTFKVTASDRPDEYKRNLAREKLEHQHGINPKHPRLQSDVYYVAAKCTRHEAHRQDFLFSLTTKSSQPILVRRASSGRSRRSVSSLLMVTFTFFRSRSTRMFCQRPS